MIQNKPFLIVFLIIILCFSLLMLGLRFKKEDFSRLVYGVFRSSFIAQFRHNNYQTDYYKKKGREVERGWCEHPAYCTHNKLSTYNNQLSVERIKSE